jgi:hypothetical protein
MWWRIIPNKHGKKGRYLHILAITNKKITFRRTQRLWSETLLDRKIPINKLNGKSFFVGLGDDRIDLKFP